MEEIHTDTLIYRKDKVVPILFSSSMNIFSKNAIKIYLKSKEAKEPLVQVNIQVDFNFQNLKVNFGTDKVQKRSMGYL